ncbi:MAG: hypothetical protein LBB47_02930 [Spirochaetaceae bacterium]|nr:hypothetical protein [Spirochaetaceae bacterium]
MAGHAKSLISGRQETYLSARGANPEQGEIPVRPPLPHLNACLQPVALAGFVLLRVAKQRIANPKINVAGVYPLAYAVLPDAGSTQSTLSSACLTI